MLKMDDMLGIVKPHNDKIVLLEGCKRALNFLINHQNSLGIAEHSEDELETTKYLRAAIKAAEH